MTYTIAKLVPVFSEGGECTAPSGRAFDYDADEEFVEPDEFAAADRLSELCPEEMAPGDAWKFAAQIVAAIDGGGRVGPFPDGVVLDVARG